MSESDPRKQRSPKTGRVLEEQRVSNGPKIFSRMVRWLDHNCTLLEHDWEDEEYVNELGHTKVYEVCQRCGSRKEKEND